jgi:hypothetical protein
MRLEVTRAVLTGRIRSDVSVGIVMAAVASSEDSLRAQDTMRRQSLGPFVLGCARARGEAEERLGPADTQEKEGSYDLGNGVMTGGRDPACGRDQWGVTARKPSDEVEVVGQS